MMSFEAVFPLWDAKEVLEKELKDVEKTIEVLQCDTKINENNKENLNARNKKVVKNIKLLREYPKKRKRKKYNIFKSVIANLLKGSIWALILYLLALGIISNLPLLIVFILSGTFTLGFTFTDKKIRQNLKDLKDLRFFKKSHTEKALNEELTNIHKEEELNEINRGLLELELELESRKVTTLKNKITNIENLIMEKLYDQVASLTPEIREQAPSSEFIRKLFKNTQNKQVDVN